MPSKIYPIDYNMKMSKYVYENLQKIKEMKNMNDEQAIRYLINKEVGENIYGGKLEKENK